jgi:excisionase family DNA binding protein
MKEITNELQLLSISMAAKKLEVGKESLYKLINGGTIGVIQIGRRRKIPLCELIRFQKENLLREKVSDKDSVLTSKEIENYFGLSKSRLNKSLNGVQILHQVMEEDL